MYATLESYLLKGHLTPSELRQAKNLAHRQSCSLSRALWSLRLIMPEEFLALASESSGWPLLEEWLQTSGKGVDPELVWSVTTADLRATTFLPCAWQDDQTLIVAVEEPDHPAVRDFMQQRWPQAGYEEVLATEHQILSLGVETKLAVELLSTVRIRLFEWQKAHALRQETGAALGPTLIQLDYLKPEVYQTILKTLFDLPSLDQTLSAACLRREARLLQNFEPADDLRAFFPLGWLAQNVLAVVVSDPLDFSIDERIYQRFPGVSLQKTLGSEAIIAGLVEASLPHRFGHRFLVKMAHRLRTAIFG